MSDMTAKMLERVRALLAKADDASVGPEEADAFRAKADELMTKFAIDSYMLDKAKAGVNATVKPVRRDFDRPWGTGEFSNALYTMFWNVAEHCRCVPGWRGYGTAGSGVMPVYGLPSDLDYLDMLFTSLNVEVAMNLSPGVVAGLPVGENVFRLRQAGRGWEDITKRMWDAGEVTLTKGERAKVARYAGEREVDWNQLLFSGVWTDVKNRLANANRSFVKANNLQGERNYVKPDVYRRSFILGFEREMSRRLLAMSAQSRGAYDATHDSGAFAIAVRDVKAMALSLYEQEFPPPPPVAVSNAPRAKGRAVRMRKYAEPVYDMGAMSKGQRAAANANLHGDPGKRVGPNRSELEG